MSETLTMLLDQTETIATGLAQEARRHESRVVALEALAASDTIRAGARRLRAELARTGTEGPAAVGDAPVVAGRIRLCPRERVVTVNGQAVRVSSLEFGILWLLASDPTRVWEKKEIFRHVWGGDVTQLKTRTIDSHCSRLRTRLRQAGAGVTIINRWGVGYSLLAPESTAAQAAALALAAA